MCGKKTKHFGLDAHLAKLLCGWIHYSCYYGAKDNQGRIVCGKCEV